MSKIYFEADKVFQLNAEDSGVVKGLCRVPNLWIDRKRERTDRLHRRQPVVIENRDTGHRIIRFALGSGRLYQGQGFDKQSIALDYDAVSDLGIEDSRETQELLVRPASSWELVWEFWDHPDPAYRISMRLAIIGATTGFLGLAFGVATGVAGLI